MFILEFKNQADTRIILKNLNPELLKSIAEDVNGIFSNIVTEKYYMYAEYDKINFCYNTFLIAKNTKKSIELILLNKD